MRYKVLKDIPGAKLGQVLEEGNGNGDLYYENDIFANSPIALHQNQVRVAIEQGFIEEIKEVKRWMPKEGDTVYYISSIEDIGTMKVWSENAENHKLYKHRYDENTFRSEATAQLVLDFIKEAFRQLHDSEYNGTDSYGIKFGKARHAVLRDNNYDPNWDGVER